MWYKVRELDRKGLNKSQISRRLELDRATVRKYLEIGEEEFHKRLQQGRNLPRKLSSYLEYVKRELKIHPYLSAAQIEDRLKEHYSDLPQVHSKTVYNFVQMVRQKYDIPKPKHENSRDFEQLPPSPYGQQAQVDFGEHSMQTANGGRIKVYFFTMVLSRSRYKYVYFQDRPFTSASAIYAHQLAFEYFDGIPHEIVYDQDSVFIHDENLGDYLLTHEFQAFIQSQPFKAVFCRKADPQSKGKVENVVKYVKYNFLRGRYYVNLQALNHSGLSWLSRTANAKVHGSTCKVPAQEWETEKQHLLLLKDRAKKPVDSLSIYNVRKDNTVVYRGNFYTLPLGTYQGCKTTILLSEVGGQLSLHTMERVLLTTHTVSTGKGELIRNTDHGRDKSKTSGEKQQEALLLLGADEKAKLFLDLLYKEKPRYYYDNLRAIIKGVKDLPNEFIRQSLVFCLENKLYNGAGFCEVAINYQKEHISESSLKINLSVSDTMMLDENVDMSVQASEIITYENIIGS